MSIASGTRVGPYEVSAPLGRGGMGEVYRATDTRLGREVAIKFSAERFSERFEREAQAVAALNHPNICTLYDVAADYLVMELVEGPTLAERITEGPIPFDEAIGIAKQIAAGLEEAHDKGITHRDLKPGNIKIKPNGTVKVLDFGLAKVTATGQAVGSGTGFDNLTHSPTLSIVATQAGVILGTAAYMSPEQAKGKPVDKRADIWAFGVVLYEMLTGRPPFRGDDVGDVLAAVIRDSPGWDDVPARARRLLQLCLEKDPRKRLRDISGVNLLLDEAPPVAAGATHASSLPWAIAGMLAVIAAIAVWAPWRRSAIDDRPLARLDVDLGADVSLGSPQGTDAIISPDGDRLVWVSQNRLYTRQLSQPKAVELAGTQGAFAPFFSPDGRWVAFFAGGKLRKISVEGGASIALCDAVAGRGGSWSGDGYIVATLAGGVLSKIPEAGGAPAPLTRAAEGETPDHRWPHILPGSEAVLFTARTLTNSLGDASVDVLNFRDGRRKTVLQGGSFGRYIAGINGLGHLLYVSRGTLFAVPFDLARLDVRGTPSPVLEGVGFNPVNGAAQFDASKTGTLVYRGGGAGSLVSLQWLDTAGRTQPLPAKPGSYTQPHLSPDGSLLALSVFASGGQDVWVYDWQRDAMSRLTFGGGTYFWPVWSRNGRYIVFTGGFGAGGMLWTRADGASKPQPLTETKNGQFPWSFSPDGKRLAFADFPGGVGSGDIWTVPVEEDSTGLKAGKPEVFLRTPANELYPAFSPDGHWIAYRSEESGSSEIYVRAFPDKGGKWLISNNGGTVAVWSRNGRELFYRTADQRIMAVNYTAKQDVFVADKPRLWTETRMAETGTGQNFDVAPDGKRLTVLMPSDTADDRQEQNQVIFLQNFSDEIRRRVNAR